jgi:hypothetical protein
MKRLSEQFQSTQDRFKEEMPALRKSIRFLATCGWTIPTGSTPYETRQIAKLKNPDEIEAYFVQYYAANDGAELSRVRDNLLKNEKLDRWHNLIDQCFSSYNDKRYLVVVPSLITIITGLLAALQGRFQQTSDEKRFVSERRKQTETASFEEILLFSVDDYVAELFKKSHFSDSEPPFLNRHWILKGRSATEWKQADCLKLFQCIDTICMVFRQDKTE